MLAGLQAEIRVLQYAAKAMAHMESVSCGAVPMPIR